MSGAVRVQFHYTTGVSAVFAISSGELGCLVAEIEANLPKRRPAFSFADASTGQTVLVDLRRVVHVRELGPVELPPAEDARPGFWRWVGWLR